MKRIYWRPRGISRTVLALIAAFSVAGMIIVEHFQIRTRQPYFDEKLEASQLALKAMGIIQEERMLREPDIETLHDPTESGLIGLAMTPVTSDPGSLPAKQTSINPNFAAVIVQWLRQCGVNKGDVVAVGVSGSFPALNVCVYAALATVQARPVIISSASSSQWGANLPDFLWLDMERILHDNHVFGFRSMAASIGGVEDRAVGMSAEGRELLEKAIERNGLDVISVRSITESIDTRMKLYARGAAGAPIRAYINVGGGTTSVGTSIGKRLFEPGLNLHPPPGLQTLDSVMTRFSRATVPVPVIHITQIEHLAGEHGLPLRPRQMPTVGEGRVFHGREYNLWLAGVVLLVILASLYAFIHTEIGYRLLQTPVRSKGVVTHEPMI
jgi:poly-gamma-glutamate system protein